MVRFYICVCVCIYKSRLRFGFVCKPRFNFGFVSVQTCLFVCLCIHNQCDLLVCMSINLSLVFNLYVQTKVPLSVCKCVHQG